MTDRHSDDLASAVAALTPEGDARVDELLRELAAAGGAVAAWANAVLQPLEDEAGGGIR